MSLALGPYFPILRIKGSEKEALRQLTPAQQPGVTPLIQQTRYHSIMNLEAFILETRPVGSTSLIDIWDTETWADIQKLITHLQSKNRVVIPVIKLSTPSAVIKELAHSLANKTLPAIAYRATQQDYAHICSMVNSLTTRGAPTQNIIGIIDLQNLYGPSATGKQTIAVQGLKAFRTNKITNLVIAGGSMPPSLKTFAKFPETSPYIPAQVKREEWDIWQNLITGKEFPNVAFGDYTVFPSKISKGGGGGYYVAFRYTDKGQWLIFNAGLSTEPGNTSHYKALAANLVAHSAFTGPHTCWGDAEIASVAAGAPRKGGSSKPLSFTANHHIITVAGMILGMSRGPLIVP
ncbi:MAG: hypothetical protein ABFD50_04020 [Smithella sp.]